MTKLLNVRIENSYHNTVEIIQGESLEEVKKIISVVLKLKPNG